MPVWEYKVITSGKGGFATPALLESFLNQLGKDEWEIIHFQSPSDNPLAFTGLARRSTQRDWTLEDAAASAARAEADKLRAEFEAKFKGVAGTAGSPEDKPESIAAETAATDDGLRKLRNTDSDLDPDAAEDEDGADEWEQLEKEDELPTFFEAIQPLMRRNQRGAGLSAGVDHLAKKWGMEEADIIGALKECGFTIPEDENAPPAYLEYDGDLYWVNVNRRGELWINTKEKPRPVFRIVQAAKVAAEEAPAVAEPAAAAPSAEAAPAPARPEDGPAPAPATLPEGPALLEKIRPLMRRNRGGSGGSGSTGFLSRALKCREADLLAAFATLGLALPEASGDSPVRVEIDRYAWWLNRDQRGGVWINANEAKRPEAAKAEPEASAAQPSAEAPASVKAPADAAAAPESVPAPGAESTVVLAAVRLLLKRTKTGSVAGAVENLAATLGKTPEELLGALVAAGLKTPEKARERPVFVEHAGEIFWLNKNAKEELWLNAKASKFAAAKSASDEGEAPKGEGRRGRGRGHPAAESKPEEGAAPSVAGEPSS